MIKIGYVNGERIHINDYNPTIHIGNIKCAQGHDLVAKRGDIRQHHFCHKKNEGDNSCGGKMGEWHNFWQKRLKQTNIELRFNKEILKIADAVNIVNNKLTIIEFQKSKMSREEMKLRETFYTRRDLMSQWNLKDCTSQLIWVFSLVHCDIQIEYIFGDIICFKWVQGAKFMCYSSTGYTIDGEKKNKNSDKLVKTFYDFGKRDLVQILYVHKPRIMTTKFIGRLVSLNAFDKSYFSGILNDLSNSEKRLNTYKMCKYKGIQSEKTRRNIVKLCKKFYIDKDISIDQNSIKELLDE